jgi:hypothetical protein
MVQSHTFSVGLRHAREGENDARRIRGSIPNKWCPEQCRPVYQHDEHFEKYYFYFSPGAAEIARSLLEAYSGDPCAAPIREEQTPVLLVGHSDAREALLRSAE